MPDIKILFDFHVLVDTDIGVIKYIQSKNELRKPAFFQDKLLNLPDAKILELLNLNPSYNPLDSIAVFDKRGKLDNILRQLITNGDTYKEILKRSKKTLVFKSYELFNRMNDMSASTTVLYYDDTEFEFITKELNIPENQCIKYTQNMDINDFGTVYIMVYADLMKFDIDSIQGKVIYIPDNEFNIDRLDLLGDKSEVDLLPKQAVTQRLHPNNVVKIFNMYNESNYANNL